MSKSSGSIVGGSGVPTTSLVINTRSTISDYTLMVCPNREVIGTDVELNYQITYPQTVGCGIFTASLLSGESEISVMGLNMNNHWMDITTSVTVSFNPVSSTLGCFNQGMLTITFNESPSYCDFLVCITGTGVLGACKVSRKCEKYCVYIMEIPDSDPEPNTDY